MTGSTISGSTRRTVMRFRTAVKAKNRSLGKERKSGPKVSMTREAQIQRLKKRVGEVGLQESENLAQDYSKEVLSLAFRMKAGMDL
jgi:hypothetical protein